MSCFLSCCFPDLCQHTYDQVGDRSYWSVFLLLIVSIGAVIPFRDLVSLTLTPRLHIFNYV